MLHCEFSDRRLFVRKTVEGQDDPSSLPRTTCEIVICVQGCQTAAEGLELLTGLCEQADELLEGLAAMSDSYGEDDASFSVSFGPGPEICVDTLM